MRRFFLILEALALALAAATATASAQPVQRVKVGTLTCDISAGIGMIIGSRKTVQCLFAPDMPGAEEAYQGSINKLGIDIGATSGGQMVWIVFAPTTLTFGALAGTYVGATAEATLAVGLGANALIGGSNRTVALQPLSMQGQTGLNIAGGVAELVLDRVR